MLALHRCPAGNEYVAEQSQFEALFDLGRPFLQSPSHMLSESWGDFPKPDELFSKQADGLLLASVMKAAERSRAARHVRFARDETPDATLAFDPPFFAKPIACVVSPLGGITQAGRTFFKASRRIVAGCGIEIRGTKPRRPPPPLCSGQKRARRYFGIRIALFCKAHSLCSQAVGGNYPSRTNVFQSKPADRCWLR